MLATDPSYARRGRDRSCPRCRCATQQVPRRWTDRLLSLWMPVLRYQCRSLVCGWQGLLQRRRHRPARQDAKPRIKRNGP